MVTRWTFAGLGAPIHLDDSPAVVHHYGSLFSTSLPELMLIVAGFAVLFLAIVSIRLSRLRA